MVRSSYTKQTCPRKPRRLNFFFQDSLIVATQVTLLTPNSMATSKIAHAILSVGVIFELLGAMLAIIFLQHPQLNQPPKHLIWGTGLVKMLHFILIAFGIVG